MAVCGAARQLRRQRPRVPIQSSIAINPAAANPLRTTAHKPAHIVLGHSDTARMDGGDLPRNLKEVEAEVVALIVVESLG